jgi:hypothetical protein
MAAMNAAVGAAAVAAFAATVFAVTWWGSSPPPAERATGGTAPADVDRLAAAVDSSNPQASSGDADPTSTPAFAAAAAPAALRGAPDTSAGSRAVAWLRWPVGSGTRQAAVSAANAEPAVPVRLAFRALWYLGVDPEAEKTWTRAINDPNMPEEVRSDLIVDMIDEGYTDNNQPTKADLPVIFARLQILERHAPYAMDQVNARAFEKAYRSLLQLYIRLGGDPPARR